ncbi:peptidoglycan D,D-transpeptidase FtsI family protein [Arthrobacter sp. H14]|uniref:peptidoglycan D,D-transpeptidase FtsI family protein n=1 Tax=Arthrobacter sp. H14 TaxID=1312959 RepID=UPI000478C97E|nr:penicillin-binding transpeptidase domain-containing protein [Arthrobacter sp. H14]
MNQAIRNSWVIALTMFALVLGSVTYVQFFVADELQANDWNNRQLYQQFGSDRGAILVDGQQVAHSVPSDDQFNYQRVYEPGEMYAHLTGYFSLVYGATALEDVMGEELSGDASELFIDKAMSLLSGNQPKGYSVELTIDPEIQRLAYEALGNQTGSIVVMDPETGDIIAMVSKPSYDPNLLAGHSSSQVVENYQQITSAPNNPLFNRAIEGDLYAPGSVFKIIDTVAALESDEYSPESTLPNPAAMEFPGLDYTLPNFATGGCSAQREASFAFALAQSCNTPFASIALELGGEAIQQEAQEFGFGQELSIPLRVTPSIFPDGLDDAALAQSSIGQRDVRVTPLQVAMMSAAIANDGVIMKPQLVETVRSPDLQPVSSPEPEVFSTPTSPEIANQITDWMVGVVDEGIGSAAAIEGVEVAGKTGTAELSTPGQNNSWFTGFAPADDPQAVVSIVVSDVDIETGAQFTGPNAKRLLEAVLNR